MNVNILVPLSETLIINAEKQLIHVCIRIASMKKFLSIIYYNK